MKYIAIVESSINWTEEVDTVENAIQLLRDLVETDKRYTFAGTTNFHWQSHGANASKAMQVKWLYMDEEGNPHTMSKSVRIKDMTRANEREMLGLPPHKSTNSALERWEEIRKMFL